MTIEKKIELLKAMAEHAMEMYELYQKDGENENARRSLREHIALHAAIQILEDDIFACDMAEIFIA